jgi:hypothetical protein
MTIPMGAFVPRPPKPEEYRAVQHLTLLSNDDLWPLYFELGGNASSLEVEAFLEDLHDIGKYQRDILAHALNERLHDLGEKKLLSYHFDAS